jgi:hypothetical protein
MLSAFELQVILGVLSFICWSILTSGVPKIDSADIKRMLFYLSASGLSTACFAWQEAHLKDMALSLSTHSTKCI